MDRKPLYSLRQAGEVLGIDPREVKGAAMALGLELEPCGTSLTMTADQFERLRRAIGRPEPAESR